MKIFKSIKWRLQLWYGLILVLVLAGFGFTAYQLEWGRQMRRIDDELQRRFNIIADALHRPPPRPEQGRLPFDYPLPDRPPAVPPPEQNSRPPREFNLPPQAAALFGTNTANNFYFRISSPNSRGDNEIAQSPNYVEPSVVVGYNPFFARENRLASPPWKSPNQPQLINFQNRREIAGFLPPGEWIEVGCSIVPELKELHRTALNLAAVGGLILLIGLTGGWWLVGRALRPIDSISNAAVKISAGDLSQRINVAETESELGRLAAVLNSTFARLETAFAQQRQFTADAAHELRTPVSVMLTQTQTALQRERSAAEYRETIEACQRASQRMRRLIESLLELARLDAGQETLKRMNFDLSQTVKDCVELVRPLAAARSIKIQSDLPPVEGHGDAERLAQVITNLLANAVQYNKDNGEVRISAKVQGSMILLAVSDSGPGISSADLPHVFDRFYRADPSRSSGQTGLGLAISKAIVEAHGGTISVSSQPGAGTTFTVVLPAT